MEKVRNLVVPDYILPTVELFEKLQSYQHLFFFYRRGMVEVLENAIDMKLRISREYQPASYYEYDDLLQLTLNDLDKYAFRFMKGQKTDDIADLIEIAIEHIESSVEKMVSQSMPQCDYQVQSKRWNGTALSLTLILP